MVIIKNIIPFGSEPKKLINANGTLYFVDNDQINSEELWKSDGTDVGTITIIDIKFGGNSADAEIDNFTLIYNTLFFVASDGIEGKELWKVELPILCQNTASYQGTATDVLYEANNSIISIHTVPFLPNFTIYKAKAITLNSGFRTESGAKFMTIVAGCQ